MRQAIFLLFLISGFFFTETVFGQKADTTHPVPKDTLLIKSDSIQPVGKPTANLAKDSTAVKAAKDSITLRKKHNPRKATILSAVFPGAGQVYNHKYWKLPIVYAAIGIPAYAFFYNKSWYQKCQYALTVTVNGSTGDSLAKVDPQLKPFVTNGDVNGIITNRDSFRKNQDYSVLFLLLFYGLNIVDATVDAHLRDFNVNSDLSFKIKPMIITYPSLVTGFTMVFDIHKARPRSLNMN
jgi:hypothetical protein